VSLIILVTPAFTQALQMSYLVLLTLSPMLFLLLVLTGVPPAVAARRPLPVVHGSPVAQFNKFKSFSNNPVKNE
jgi:hypothetical protein